MKTLYVVTNLVNGKRYVGITCDFERRCKEHISGKGSLLVFRAIRKYGLDNIEFESLVEGPDKWIKDFEIRMIASLETFGPKGYNLTAGGESVNHSEKTCKKMSDSHKGVTRGPHSLEHRKKLSEAHKGKILSLEHRKKLSEARKGKTHSLESRKKMSESHKNPSNETRKKMSEASKGRTHSKETKRKISDTKKGVICHERTRKKISKAKKGKFLRGKHPNAITIIVNGVKYDCIKTAAEILGVSRKVLDRARKKADSNTFSFTKRGKCPNKLN